MTGQLSDDENWRWDGEKWIPVTPDLVLPSVQDSVVSGDIHYHINTTPNVTESKFQTTQLLPHHGPTGQPFSESAKSSTEPCHYPHIRERLEKDETWSPGGLHFDNETINILATYMHSDAIQDQYGDYSNLDSGPIQTGAIFDDAISNSMFEAFRVMNQQPDLTRVQDELSRRGKSINGNTQFGGISFPTLWIALNTVAGAKRTPMTDAEIEEHMAERYPEDYDSSNKIWQDYEDEYSESSNFLDIGFLGLAIGLAGIFCAILFESLIFFAGGISILLIAAIIIRVGAWMEGWDMGESHWNKLKFWHKSLVALALFAPPMMKFAIVALGS